MASAGRGTKTNGPMLSVRFEAALPRGSSDSVVLAGSPESLPADSAGPSIRGHYY